MKWIESYSEFYEFLAKVLLCAPDDFPKEEYLEEKDQMNLQKAYDELNGGLRFIEERLDQQSYIQVRDDLAASKDAYETGNEKEGAFLIQKIRRALQ